MKQGPVAEKALLVVAQSGLSWTGAAELQRTSRALCEACRRCVPARVHVGADTPRALWARTEVSGGGRVRGGGRAVSCEENGGTESAGGGREPCDDGGGDGAHRKGTAANGKSETTASGLGPRLVPPLKITSLVWAAPAIHLGDGSDLPAELNELTFCRDFNRPLSGIRWPPNLARLTFGSKFNRELSHRVHGRPMQPGPGTPPSTSCASRDHGRRSDRRHWGRDHHGKKLSYDREPELCLLPGGLKELTLGKQFNKPLPRRALPPGLVSLTLGRNFRHHDSVRDAVWPTGLKRIRWRVDLYFAMRVNGTRVRVALHKARIQNRGGHSETDRTIPKKEFVWPAGLDRVEFWQEGRAVVSLKGGKDLDSDSVEWLDRN
ncbi:unnamed protein product [Scytosiphon promiscuus]